MNTMRSQKWLLGTVRKFHFFSIKKKTEAHSFTAFSLGQKKAHFFETPQFSGIVSLVARTGSFRQSHPFWLEAGTCVFLRLLVVSSWSDVFLIPYDLPPDVISLCHHLVVEGEGGISFPIPHEAIIFFYASVGCNT
jgi:hypothetical protein